MNKSYRFFVEGRVMASWWDGMEGNFLRILSDFWESVSLRVSEESPASRGPLGVPTGVPWGVPNGVPECDSTNTLLLNSHLIKMNNYIIFCFHSIEIFNKHYKPSKYCK
jgi:hypothetical protein